MQLQIAIQSRGKKAEINILCSISIWITVAWEGSKDTRPRCSDIPRGLIGSSNWKNSVKLLEKFYLPITIYLADAGNLLPCMWLQPGVTRKSPGLTRQVNPNAQGAIAWLILVKEMEQNPGTYLMLAYLSRLGAEEKHLLKRGATCIALWSRSKPGDTLLGRSRIL